MGERPEDEIDRFTEQARWLLDYHEKRSESICSRAVALLGFAGVILALLLRGGLPDGAHVNPGVQVFFVLSVAALVVAAACCLVVLVGRELRSPGIAQLRQDWLAWVENSRRDHVAADIAEPLLLAGKPDRESPLDWSMKSASSRATWFQWAAGLMGLSLVSLTVLLIIFAAQVYF